MSLRALFISLFLCVSHLGFSQALREYQINFSLPVNWSVTPQINLFVTIPKGYTSLQPFTEWSEAALIEFVPDGEDGENWSEIITINKYVGQTLPADELIHFLKSHILEKVKNGKVWREEDEEHDAYQEAQLGLSYDYNHRHEVLGVRAYTGPYDGVAIQYTIRPKQGEADRRAISKIEDFFFRNLILH